MYLYVCTEGLNVWKDPIDMLALLSNATYWNDLLSKVVCPATNGNRADEPLYRSPVHAWLGMYLLKECMFPRPYNCGTLSYDDFR